MGKLLGSTFAAGGDGFVIIALAGLAVVGWLIAEASSPFNGKIAGLIRMLTVVVAVLMMIGTVNKLFTAILKFAGQ